MAEKLNRDRSTRNQTRTTPGRIDNQNISRRQYSSSRDERETTIRRRDTQNKKSGSNNYPPLKDYTE